MSSMSDHKKRLWAGTGAYVIGNLLLLAVGIGFGIRGLEMTGFFLLAGTFIPLPYDIYLLAVTPDHPAIPLALVAAALNTIAVLFERWFVLGLLSEGRGRQVLETVRETRLSGWFRRAPFLVVFIAGFTVLPFEPVRFLAIINGYNVVRYAASTFIGRGVRFILLAFIGDYLARFDWLHTVLWVALGIYLLTLFDPRQMRKLRKMLAPLRRQKGVGDEGVATQSDEGGKRRD